VAIKFVKNAPQYLVLFQTVGWFKLCAAVKELTVLAHNFATEAVERVNRNFVGVFADNTHQALAHGSLPTFGKSKQQDIFREGVGLLKNIRYTDAKQLGFTRTRPRDHHNRTLDSIDSLPLRIVELIVAFLKTHSPYYSNCGSIGIHRQGVYGQQNRR